MIGSVCAGELWRSRRSWGASGANIGICGRLGRNKQGSNPDVRTYIPGYSYLRFCHPSLLISLFERAARGFGHGFFDVKGGNHLIGNYSTSLIDSMRSVRFVSEGSM